MVTRRRSPTCDSDDMAGSIDSPSSRRVPLHVVRHQSSQQQLEQQRHRRHHEHLSDGEDMDEYPDIDDNDDLNDDGIGVNVDNVEDGVRGWSRQLSQSGSSNSSNSSFDYEEVGDQQQSLEFSSDAVIQPSSPAAEMPCLESQRGSHRSSRKGAGSSWKRACPNTSNSSSNNNNNPNKNDSPPLFLVGLILIGVVAAYLSRSSVGFAVQRASELNISRTHLANKLFKTESDLAKLKREMMAMNALIAQQEKAEESSFKDNQRKQQEAVSELSALQGRIKSLNSKGDALKDRVQSMSKTELTSKYGDGTKFVELELVFPEDENHVASDTKHANMKGGGGPTKFTIQLAADGDMPHSVFTFLEMVSYKLLDGCSFILNALHVLKAAPLPYDGSLAAAKAKAFAEHGLESVAFREYNPSHPHQKNTVGFAADGSPSFYINTEDNTDIHVGDPCFGKIVAGFDTVKRLEASPTRNGIWFAQKIGIKTARIVSDPNKNKGPALRQPSQDSNDSSTGDKGSSNKQTMQRLRQSDSNSADK